MMNTTSRATLALGLALLAAAPAGARQIRAGTPVPAGVPTNAGGGTPTGVSGGSPSGFGNVNPGNIGGGFTGNGSIGINSPFYGNGGYGGYGGYGGNGFGGYGGYGGYGGNGFGGYGGYSGIATGFTPNYGGNNYLGTYGGLGLTIGMSPYDQEAVKENEYALMASQRNLQNARAMQAYQSANLMQQKAMAAAMANREQMTGNGAGYEPRYNVATASTRPYPRQLAARGRNRARGTPDLLPREKVLDTDGRILWPTSLPRDPDLGSMRQGVDTAFHDVVDDFRKRNRGSVRETVNARDKLYAFGNLAEQKLQEEKRDADIPEFQVFLASLDRALVSMANAAPKAATARTTPDNAPKSAGSVLLDSVEKDSPASKEARPNPKEVRPVPAGTPAAAPRSADQPPPPPTPDGAKTPAPGEAKPPTAGTARPDSAPKSAGDVLKDSIGKDGDGKP